MKSVFEMVCSMLFMPGYSETSGSKLARNLALIFDKLHFEYNNSCRSSQYQSKYSTSLEVIDSTE